MGEPEGPLQRLQRIVDQFNGTLPSYDTWLVGRNIYFNVFKVCENASSCLRLARREVNPLTNPAKDFVVAFACPDCEHYSPKPAQ